MGPQQQTRCSSLLLWARQVEDIDRSIAARPALSYSGGYAPYIIIIILIIIYFFIFYTPGSKDPGVKN